VSREGDSNLHSIQREETRGKEMGDGREGKVDKKKKRSIFFIQFDYDMSWRIFVH
jgi:hypothetical protein